MLGSGWGVGWAPEWESCETAVVGAACVLQILFSNGTALVAVAFTSTIQTTLDNEFACNPRVQHNLYGSGDVR